MKGKRRDGGSERRRNLAEVNLISEPRHRVVPSRRGCVLPFIGIGITLLAVGAALGGFGF